MFGAIAQLARAPALQAGGPGFESPLLHQVTLTSGWPNKGAKPVVCAIEMKVISHKAKFFGSSQNEPPGVRPDMGD